MVVKQLLKTIFNKVIDFVFPPQCLVCGKILHGEDGLCFQCLTKINFITNPKCSCCGRPFEVISKSTSTISRKEQKNLLCPKCMIKKHKFDKCVSAVRYDETSKKLILPFKHGDKTQLANFLGKIMNTAGRELLTETDLIIPVPIHFTRLLKRKYNQASLIGNTISKLSNKPIRHRILIRTTATASQGHLSPKQRKQNISGAFDVKHMEEIKGKTILLVDDVYTTGATVDECAKTLKKYGAKKVFVLTFAHA